MDASAIAAMSELNIKHVRCVDAAFSPDATLFRSNMPVLQDSGGRPYFARTELLSMLQERGRDCGVALRDDAYLHIVSLNFNGESPDFSAEQAFWRDPANSQHGELTTWPLGFHGAFGTSVVSPEGFTDAEKSSMSESAVWQLDDVPGKVALLRSMLVGWKWGPLKRTDGRQLALVVHCTAGCDRTGEIIGSYMMAHTNATAVEAYANDVDACGRPPCYQHTNGMVWYCLYLQHHVYKDKRLGGCTEFASCIPFGCDCMPTKTALPDGATENIANLRSLIPAAFGDRGYASPPVPVHLVDPGFPYVAPCEDGYSGLGAQCADPMADKGSPTTQLWQSAGASVSTVRLACSLCAAPKVTTYDVQEYSNEDCSGEPSLLNFRSIPENSTSCVPYAGVWVHGQHCDASDNRFKETIFTGEGCSGVGQEMTFPSGECVPLPGRDGASLRITCHFRPPPPPGPAAKYPLTDPVVAGLLATAVLAALSLAANICLCAKLCRTRSAGGRPATRALPVIELKQPS